MSRSMDLPIYKTSYELMKLVVESVRHFPRDFRPTLGARLNDESVKLVVAIYKANAAIDKRACIAELLESLQVVELLLKLSFDLRLIATKQYSKSVEITGEVGKQAGGWKKFAERTKSP